MKSVAGRLKLDHAQFRELQAFAQFGTSDLDSATKRQLDRGLRVNEVLKQGQFAPLSLAEEVVMIYAVTKGLLDDVDVDKVGDFETGLRQLLKTSHQDLATKIETEKELSDELDAEVRKFIETFKETMPY